MEKLLKKMTLEQKASLMSGENFWNTVSIEELGILASVLPNVIPRTGIFAESVLVLFLANLTMYAEVPSASVVERGKIRCPAPVEEATPYTPFESELAIALGDPVAPGYFRDK